MATFEIFAHLDLLARPGGPGSMEESPLSELGMRQSERIADELLAEGPIDGVFATDNLRCRQSAEHLAKRIGLEVEPLQGFLRLSRLARPEDPPDPTLSAYQAGKCMADLERIRARNPEGRFAICSSGGGVVPSLLAFLAGKYELEIPPMLEIKLGEAPGSLRRGNVYTVILDGDNVAIRWREATPEFPQIAPSGV